MTEPTPAPPADPSAEPVAAATSATVAATAAAGTVTVRYWAAARAAAGVDEETRAAGVVADILAGAATEHPDLVPVLAVASTLIDGTTAAPHDVAPAGSVLEILPPFAGG